MRPILRVQTLLPIGLPLVVGLAAFVIASRQADRLRSSAVASARTLIVDLTVAARDRLPRALDTLSGRLAATAAVALERRLDGAGDSLSATLAPLLDDGIDGIHLAFDDGTSFVAGVPTEPSPDAGPRLAPIAGLSDPREFRLVSSGSVARTPTPDGLAWTGQVGRKGLEKLLSAVQPGTETWLALVTAEGHVLASARPVAKDLKSLDLLRAREGSLGKVVGAWGLLRSRNDPGADGVLDVDSEGDGQLGLVLPMGNALPGVFLASVTPKESFTGSLEAAAEDQWTETWLVAALASFLAWLMARAIAGPLGHLADSIERLARLEHDGVDPGPQWLGEFNAIHAAMDHVRRTQRSFSTFVPREVVKGLALGDRPARLEGDTRELTILFTDASGFTAWSEDKEPETLVVQLGRYLTLVTDPVLAEGGTVDKFLGDGVMAFWNAPARQPDHALRAIRAALAAQKKLHGRKGRDVAESFAFPTRIGIATGRVLVGNIGTPDRLNYTVLGDSANYASRLEGLNKRYGTGILVSESTADHVIDTVVLRPVDVVTVQGRSRAERVYEPLCTIDDPDARTHEEVASLSTNALAAYLKRDFAKAVALWEKVLAMRPEDPPSLVMRDRARELARTGVPADWTGVEHTTK